MMRHATTFQAFAAEVARALDLDCSSSFRFTPEVVEALEEILREHNADKNDEEAEKAREVRESLASTLRQALHLSNSYVAVKLLRQARDTPWPLPPVRVEVRGTAGRSVRGSCFLIGSAAECEVQLFGDASVRPIHSLVFSLPGGLLVVDPLTGGQSRQADGGRMAVDSPSAEAEAPQPECFFVFSRSHRRALTLGAKSTIAFGPPRDRHSKEHQHHHRAEEGRNGRLSRSKGSEASTAAATDAGSLFGSGSRSRSRSRCGTDSPSITMEEV